MGNQIPTTSIVSAWGNEDAQASYSKPKYDSIEIRSNRTTDLEGIGIVRPIGGEGFVALSIQDTQNKTQIYYEEFRLEPNFLSKSEIKTLKGEVTLQPGIVYRIRINYQSKGCFSYLDSKFAIKDDDHEVEMRRDASGTPEGDYRQVNLITDLKFSDDDGGRGCCG